MPTYEYACRSCGEHVEVVQSFRDDPLTECTLCGGALRKVFSAAGIIFKGDGYYVTDTRKEKAASAKSGSGSSSGTGSSADSGTKDGSKAVDAKSSDTKSSDTKGSSSSGSGSDSGGSSSKVAESA